MEFTVKLVCDSHHVPTESWRTFNEVRKVRAVSRKHALKKSLVTLKALPEYKDRIESPEWDVRAEAQILDAEVKQ